VKEAMIRERILIWLTNTSLSLKLQMDCALTVIKAIDTIRQNETVKREKSFLRCNLATGSSSNVNVMQGQDARKPNKYSQRKPKIWTKVQNRKQITDMDV